MKIYTAKPFINDKMIQDVTSVLKSGMIAQGPKVKELEEKFAKYCNVKYAAAVNSGTAALHSALYALDIKAGDEVITTPFTFVATANSILMTGAKPIFADIDEKTFNISPKEIEKKITSKTKAIMPVHLYGLIANMDEITKIAKKYNLKIIEDACQAHGAEYNDTKAGNFGDIAAFSFYATKNMMTAEGGCITTNNEDYAEKVKSFRHHGQSINQRYNYIDFGYNYRMTDIHAVLGLNQLELLENFNKRRRENASIYNELLNDVSGIEIPFVPVGYKHVYHQYTIKINKDLYGHSRDELIEHLKNNDIYASVFYPKPLHLFKPLQKLSYKKGDFPIAESISEIVLSLPVHPQVSTEDIKKIANVIINFQRN